jgi:hypothetical protein
MLAVLLAATPAIPNDVGGKYVAGAYIVFVLLLLIYVAIMGMKLSRIERDLREVAEIAEARRDGGVPAPTPSTTATPGPAATGATTATSAPETAP